jgi:hypothetical protein
VQVPDIKICAVAGHLIVGMDCAFTGHDETSQMSMQQEVKFLEDGALCMSSVDYLRLKNAVESLCYKMGSACQYEQLQATTARLESLRGKAKGTLPAETPATH